MNRGQSLTRDTAFFQLYGLIYKGVRQTVPAFLNHAKLIHIFVSAGTGLLYQTRYPVCTCQAILLNVFESTPAGKNMKNTKILVIEDEEDIQNLLLMNLESAGYQVLVTDNGYDGLKIAREELPALILLDLMLPHMDGLEVCRRLKSDARLSSIKVIMLTAKGEEIDRIVGFELGADDYVVKPFSIRELLLRVKAIIRRGSTEEQQPDQIWKHEGLEFDAGAMQLSIDGQSVDLTATEIKLLAEFIQNQGKVLSRESLLNKVWGYEFEGYNRTVDTHIRRLRVKLGKYSEIIHTSRGLGYKLDV